MKIPILATVVGLLLFLVEAASAVTDYSALNKAANDFIAVMDQLAKDMPEVQTGEGAAKIIETWAAANTTLVTSIQSIIQQDPDVVKLANPPPEFAAAYGALSQLKIRYAPLVDGTAALAKRFRDDIQVSLAIKSFRNSLELIKKVEAPELLSAGAIFRELAAVESALDQWAIEHNKKTGDIATAQDLAPYFKPNSRLQACAQRGLLYDSMGNPIVIPPVGTLPSVSGQTYASLSNFVNLSFWRPYSVR